MDLENRAIKVLKKYKIIKFTQNVLYIKDKLKKKPNQTKEVENLKKYIEFTNNLFQNELNNSIHPLLKGLKEKIRNKEYKGIIIYPLAVNWFPIQRPHHILRKLGELGYLCFFCVDEGDVELKVTEKYKNVYLVNHQEKLLPLVKNEKTTILITYFLQYLYAKCIPNRTLWVDVLDKLDFMSLYNEYSKTIWEEAINNALIVSYSAENLKEYINNRSDSILLENAVNVEDFVRKIDKLPPDLKKITNDNKKIIGYYGAVEEWFDFELIKKIEKKYSIVIIGNVNPKLDIKKYNFKNVHFLGAKEFEELKDYANYFDIAIIPFKISEMTDCVSPVKFFEYVALNKPVISTNIKEMKKYESEVVKIVNSENIEENIENLLKIKEDKLLKECKKIVKNNTWDKRIEKIIDVI